MPEVTPPDADEGLEIHRAVSDDGTEIAGSVHGTGPPLVLVPGVLGDGETVWERLLPSLTDRFTCYAMSMRSRGLSGDSSDHSPERLVEDVTSFAESVGEPVRLMGWSAGGIYALAAAETTDAVSAVAAYEPPVTEILTEDVAGRLMDTITRMAAVAEEGRLADAARTWFEFVATDEELADAASVGLFEALAPNVLVQLREFDQLFEADWTSPTDPSELAKISVPVLLLYGTRSIPDPWLIDSVRHVDEHVADSRMREITGAGHLGPVLDPEAVAEELERFSEESP